MAADVYTGECQWIVADGAERMMNVAEQLFRMQPAEIVATDGIAQWDKLSEWVNSKLPECAVSIYKGYEVEANYFGKHFAKVEVPAFVEETVEYLLRYLHATVMADLSHINRLNEIVI